MCASIAPCTWLRGRLLTQPGNWLCQTRLCPRTRMLCDWANETTRSPGPKLYEPFDGSMVSHFISLPGVTMSNWAPASEVIVELLTMLPVSSVPMYLLLASASDRSGEAAWASGAATKVRTVAAATASTAANRGRDGRTQGDMRDLRDRLDGHGGGLAGKPAHSSRRNGASRPGRHPIPGKAVRCT